MNKTDLIKKIKANNGLTMEQSTTIVNDVFNEITNSLSIGEDVSLSGFGLWSVSVLNGRKGKVPKSDKSYVSENKYVTRFKPSKILKSFVANRKVK